MTEHEHIAREHGYVRSPNGDGRRWYAGGPDIMSPPSFLDLEINHLSVRPYRLVARAYSTQRRVTLFKFETWGHYQDWLERHGKLSEPGQPAFSNSWD